MNPARRSLAWRPLVWAFGLYLAWTLATWLLEGVPRTLRRPEAVGLRLTYVVVANLGLGLLGAALVVRRLTAGRREAPAAVGFAGSARTVYGLILGFGLGLVVFLGQPTPTRAPLIVLNVFAQTLAVSTAEVLVCWVAVAAALRATGWFGGRWTLGLTAWGVSAVLFGLYHFAHSPPFDTLGMVALLTGVGLTTGAYYHLVREVWGTIAFHNFLAAVGVSQALAEAGRLEALQGAQPALYVTAAAAVVGLALVHRWITRTPSPSAQSSADHPLGASEHPARGT